MIHVILSHYTGRYTFIMMNVYAFSACATEYLSKVVHSHKFKTAAVERVLAQSVHRSVDFDAREASEAFEHLAKYGQNLLEQPWREEFRFLSVSN